MGTESRARRVGRGTGLVLAGAVGATALTGIAFADPGSDDAAPSSTESETTAAPAGDTTADPSPPSESGGRFGGPGTGPVLHGQDTIRTPEDTIVEILIQNGTIEGVSADSITVASEDGFRQTYQIDSDTKIRVDRSPAQASALTVGRPVRVIANLDKTAQRIGSTTVEGQARITEHAQEHRQGHRERFRDLPHDGSTDSASASGTTA